MDIDIQVDPKSAIKDMLYREQNHAIRKLLAKHDHSTTDSDHRVTAIISTSLTDFEQGQVSTTIFIVEGIGLSTSDSKQGHRDVSVSKGWFVSVRWLNSQSISNALTSSWKTQLTLAQRTECKAYGKCAQLSFPNDASQSELHIQMLSTVRDNKIVFREKKHGSATPHLH